MDEKRFQLSDIVLYALMVVAVLFSLIFFFGKQDPNVLMYIAYGMLILAAAIAVFASIFLMIKNPKNAKGVFIGIIGIAVVFVVAYVLSKGVITPKMQDLFDQGKITEATSKWVGTGLIGTYIIGGLAILVMIYSGIMSFFKK